jgi:hypothetical protein
MRQEKSRAEYSRRNKPQAFFSSFRIRLLRAQPGQKRKGQVGEENEDDRRDQAMRIP